MWLALRGPSCSAAWIVEQQQRAAVLQAGVGLNPLGLGYSGNGENKTLIPCRFDAVQLLLQFCSTFLTTAVLHSDNFFGLAALFSNLNVIRLSDHGWSARAEPLIMQQSVSRSDLLRALKGLLCLRVLRHSVVSRDWMCYYCS